MASAEELAAIKKAKILMVGAGGIGCELLKTLVLTGFRDIHLIDMDTIEVSNLNRQFLFRKHHVGQSKAKVAREAVLKFRPDVNIVAYHANVKSTEFNVEFFQNFHVVLNGLDNLDARRHVNRLCLAAGVPLVESGTTGYLGQVTVHIKGKTECYECQPKPAPKTYPICTITSTPSKPVHCVVWAKELAFTRLFGDKNQANDLDSQTKEASSASEQQVLPLELQEGESVASFAFRVFDYVFGHNIEAALKNEDAWKSRRKPVPLYLNKILPNIAEEFKGSCENGARPENSCSAMSVLGLKNPQEVWSIEDNARVFLKSIEILYATKSKAIGTLVFDKDDQLAVEFVSAAANIRSYSFGIPMLSLFDLKGIAGNIVHAIATTNAIIAGLIVLEAIKILTSDFNHSRMTYCLEHPSKKLLLMPVEPFEPNSSCYVCSQTPLSLEVNTSKSKLRDVVEKIVKAKLSVHSPVIMQGSNILYETGEDLEKDMVLLYTSNLDKFLVDLPTPITNGTVLSVEDFQQEFSCNLHIKHRDEFDEEKEPDGMILTGKWLTSQTPEQQLNVPGGPTEGNNVVEAVAGETKTINDELQEVDGDFAEILEVNTVADKKRKIQDEEQAQKRMRVSLDER
ncbi:hypothetical protein O6H91_17G031800 [Diphasiastrum complanatum]|uniref:Uncharacterized protein n=1 Tax=Diphasiastrum complanatum TaxID=34168 RepID=A0ACC2B6G5_DIPCM|nr:hypothetical protein O6H91_17G031800 [Diphasiastrum complanatum]